MKEPPRRGNVQSPARRTNWTTVALMGGLVLLILGIAYFATNRNSEQDKLSNTQVAATAATPSHEKFCTSNATYDFIKHELFRRAAQVRGSDSAAYDKLSAYAVVRMDNAVMESEDRSTGVVKCSGSLSLDLPPGVEVAGGRRTLMSDIDYAVDANGSVVLSNADAIVGQLATLTGVEQPPRPQPPGNEVAPEENGVASQPANVPPGPQTNIPGRPSFDCSKAHTQGEMAVCSDSGLSALDANMMNQYSRALDTATPEQRALLRMTARRFAAYRDRCAERKCIADAYVGRMREIRDIMEGRVAAPR